MKRITRKIISLILILYMILTLCFSYKNNPLPHFINNSAPKLQRAILLPKKFYKKLTGTIDGHIHIIMDLNKNGSLMSGYYFYKGIGTTININGSIDPSGKVTLTEVDEKNKSKGTFSGTFTSEKTFEGTWTNLKTNKQLPFKLSQTFTGFADITFDSFDQPNCSTKIDIKSDSDISYISPYDTTCSDLNISLIKVKTGNEKINSLINKAIISAITGNDTVSIDTFINKPLEYDTYYEIDYSCSVTTNDENVLSIQVNDWEFTGGAHGNGNYSFLNFDLLTGKQITLDELLKPDYSDKLDTIAAQIFYSESDRNQWQFPDGHFALNGNFAITTEGLLFGFQEYEIGPYIAGGPQVLVPYRKIRSLIEPNGILKRFIER